MGIMKTTTLKQTYKGVELLIYVMVDNDGVMLDMLGYERQYFSTVKAANKRAKEMFKTEIDTLKFG